MKASESLLARYGLRPVSIDNQKPPKHTQTPLISVPACRPLEIETDTPEAAINAFWDKVAVYSPNECWPWLGAVNKDGYGIYCAKPKIQQTTAIRFMFLLTRSPIPARQHIAHSCIRNRSCVAPHHLWLASPQQNMVDKWRSRTYKPYQVIEMLRGFVAFWREEGLVFGEPYHLVNFYEQEADRLATLLAT